VNDIAAIRAALEQVRTHTLRLFAAVDAADFHRQIHQDFSPVGWHLGHIGVTEGYWILQQCKGEPSLSAAYDRFFTPTDNPKLNRVHLPPRAEILAYLHTVRQRVLAFLEGVDFTGTHPLLQDAGIVKMLIQHEEQHNETIQLILNMLAASRQDPSPSSRRPPRPFFAHDKPLPPSEREVFPLHDDMVRIPAGLFLMGSDHAADTLDNERPQHAVYVEEFLIDRYPVTNKEFLHFVTADGYHNQSWWSPEGWQWRVHNSIEHPFYWHAQPDGGWVVEGLGHTRSLQSDAPVACVSWYEADAYARSVGKRLPTEAEREKAACWDLELQKKRLYPWGDPEPDEARANFDARDGGPTPVGHHPAGSSSSGCHDMCGNVWEWTATWFHPYPGFIAHPYEGYSVPYFDQQHRVLKGGSWATHRHVLRPTFRNWYYPWVREIFAGFRCAR